MSEKHKLFNLGVEIETWIEDLGDKPGRIAEELSTMGVYGIPGEVSPLVNYLWMMTGRNIVVSQAERQVELAVVEGDVELLKIQLTGAAYSFQRRFDRGEYPLLVEQASPRHAPPFRDKDNHMDTPWGVAQMVAPVDKGVCWVFADGGRGLMMTLSLCDKVLSPQAKMLGAPFGTSWVTWDGDCHWAAVARESGEKMRKRIMRWVPNLMARVDPERYLKLTLNASEPTRDYLQCVAPDLLMPAGSVVAHSDPEAGLLIVRCAGGRVATATANSYAAALRALANGAELDVGALELLHPSQGEVPWDEE